jgi:hypothetical protein
LGQVFLRSEQGYEVLAQGLVLDPRQPLVPPVASGAKDGPDVMGKLPHVMPLIGGL